MALLELWIEQTVVDLTASIEGEADLDGRLAELWGGIVRRDSASGDAWLLLEFELWLHAARDPLLGEVGAQRSSSSPSWSPTTRNLIAWSARF